jgi:peptidoglycan/xylan/chitin deacetylase (PgdA/CDA1 family)
MHKRVFPCPYYCTAAVLIILVMVSLIVPGSAEDRAAAAMDVAAAQPAPTPPADNVGPPVILIQHAAHAGRMVALTFDDGPSPQYTPQVLALLARYQAIATFCMIGSEVVRYPKIVHDVVAAGMSLCDHTVTHDERLRHRSKPRMEAEIVGGRDDVQAAAGPNVPVGYFRAPGGAWSEPMQAIAAHNGMKSLGWSVDTRDWTQPGVAQIMATAQHQVRPGAVILLHDGGGRRDQTVAALGQLLPWLVAQGYQFDVPG